MKRIGALLVLAVCACAGSHGSVAGTAEIRLGNMKAERILFLGNSITAVPQLNRSPIYRTPQSHLKLPLFGN